MTNNATIPIAVDQFEHDAFGLQTYARRLEDFMLIERTFVEGALVVSLGAPFGSGKTTFLKMWESDLKLRRQNTPTLPHPIILNAWESDFCGDPFLAVISELVNVVEKVEGGKTQASTTFRQAATQAAWFGVGLANAFVSNWSGVDPVEAGQLATEKSEGKPDILANYKLRIESLEHIRTQLGRHFGEGTAGAIVMIDELDRCRPEYAIGYLETIKHVFGVKGLMFVLAVDSTRLAAAAETVFGHLNFDEFYRKFVHRSVTLPAPDEKGRTELIRRYVNQFIEREGVRVSFAKIENHHLQSIVQIMGALSMTPRQAQEVFRITGHVFAGTNEHRGQLLWCLTSATLLLVILRVGDSKIFESLKRKSIPPEEFGSYLIKLVGVERAEWWFSLYLTGMEAPPSGTDLEALYKKLGWAGTNREFGQFFQGWGHRTGRIPEIITKIEELQNFR